MCYNKIRMKITRNPCFNTGTLRIRQAQFELELRFVGYVYVKTLQLNITAKNENNSYALAA